MITRTDLEERVREWGLREEIVEKDYVLGWILWGIGSDERLSTTWVFKGGTCLKKCYIETYRFSEDLDFTVLPGGPILPTEIEPILNDILRRVGDESGINFAGRPPLLKGHPSGLYTEGRIYYQGPRNAPKVTRIKLDLSSSEEVVRPTVLRMITHAYPDELPEPATIRCYSFDEIFAEKIRAMGERGRPRDLYDIINLFRRSDLQAEPQIIHSVLVRKCQSKSIPVPTFTAIESSNIRTELEAEWANMLSHQLPALPPFESFWEELPKLFGWLEGTHEVEKLEPIPLGVGEEEPAKWTPPPTVWTWNVGAPLETIRFAASNHLCVKLGYDGTTRIIEPYSLRQTSDGNLLLHAIRIDSREHRSYRVDRIQSIEVTTQPFRPVYKVEFSHSGAIQAPPTIRTTRQSQSRSNTVYRRSGLVYIIECPYCKKRFRRKNHNTNLNPHKDKFGYPCPGRYGYMVEYKY